MCIFESVAEEATSPLKGRDWVRWVWLNARPITEALSVPPLMQLQPRPDHLIYPPQRNQADAAYPAVDGDDVDAVE
jgi:hypothetical protein